MEGDTSNVPTPRAKTKKSSGLAYAWIEFIGPRLEPSEREPRPRSKLTAAPGHKGGIGVVDAIWYDPDTHHYYATKGSVTLTYHASQVGSGQLL